VFNAVVSLQKAFAKLIKKRKLVTTADKSPSEDTPEARLKRWLKDNYRRYQISLLSLLRHEEPSVQVASLEALMELLKSEADQATASKDPNVTTSQFDNDAYLRIMSTAVDNPRMNEHLLEKLLGYIREYDDVRYYSFGNVTQIAKNRSEKPVKGSTNDDSLAESLFAILTAIENPVPASAAEISNFHALAHPAMLSKTTLGDPSAHRRAYSTALLGFLRLRLGEGMHKKILLVLDRVTIPNMVDPNLLIDYLTAAVDAGELRGYVG
jgi:hypothetical protein